MTGSQQPSPTCSSSRPLVETVTSRVWPTHSPANGAKDAVSLLTGAGRGAVVLVTVTVTVFVVTPTGRVRAREVVAADVGDVGDVVGAAPADVPAEPLP